MKGFTLTTLKSLTIIASTVVFVLVLITCNVGEPPSESDLPVEYTDVVYSADGTQVTLYLDGVGVPMTQQQRAITTEMVKMAHDFFEVVFVALDAGSPVVARATWELGLSAGISGVYRGTDPSVGCFYNEAPSYAQALNHNPDDPTTFADRFLDPWNNPRGYASLLVGRKSDKVLLAAGLITHVNGSTGTQINSSTKSVTFTVYAIKSNLDPYTDNEYETSFKTASGSVPSAGGLYGYGVYIRDNVNVQFTKANGMSGYVHLKGVKYPYYKLPQSSSIATQYILRTSNNIIDSECIRVIYDPLGIKYEVKKNYPSFSAGGQHYYVQNDIDLKTTIDIMDWYVRTDGLSSKYILEQGPENRLFFEFNTADSQGGIFSFTFRVPVFNLTRLPSNNSGPSFTTWYLQPGFGPDLYLLDNGVDAGGSILMGYNVDINDLNIATTNVPW